MADTTPITTVGIVTADRPPTVRRALDSIIRHCDRYGRRPRFVVIDGSRQPANRTATAVAVLATAETSGHDVQYVGQAEATDFGESLQARGAPALRVLPGSAGANRNLLLLLTAGERILTVDDDVVFETWVSPNRDEGLAVIGDHDDFLETAFFPNRTAALAAAVTASADLFAAHTALVGRSLADLTAASSRPPDFTRSCTHIHAALQEGRPLVVKATFSGIAGDAGSYCPHRLLFATGSLRDQLWSNPNAFATAMQTREVTRIAARTSVAHDSGCMATCMGLSNETIVPPFITAGRNEDGVFGVMLAACDPSTVFGHVPLGVVHDSDRSSTRGAGPIRSATESRLSELIMSLVPRGLRGGFTRSPGGRVRRIGEALDELGKMDGREFVDLVTQVTLERRGREFAVAGAAKTGCPAHWRAGLAEYQDQFAKSVTKPEFFLPIEFHGLGSLEAGYRALQTSVQRFGELLISWPALWESARVLNTGRHIG